jgi:hypothetical protein
MSNFDPRVALKALASRTKLAAPRAVKIMRQLASQGNYDAVKDMAQQLHAGNALKISGPGTNLFN